jgi:hypothetical protein
VRIHLGSDVHRGLAALIEDMKEAIP